MEWDGPTASIVEYVRSADFASLSSSCVHAVVRNYLDCVGCAAAGFEGDSSVIARRLAATTSGTPAASAFGLAGRPLIESAILANATATRYQDWNDGGLDAGHPSDMSPAIMAVAEATGSSGRDLITALAISYETVRAIGEVSAVRDRAWDQVFYLLIGTAAAVGYLLRLTDDQLANAISLAITPSIPLRVTRTGQMSHWKSVASGHASVHATYAARLAQAGMTGPPHVFDGIEAVFEKVTGPFELGKIGPKPGRPSVPELVHHKPFPALNNSMGPIDLMLKLRTNFTPDEVRSITLHTFYLGWHEGGGGQGDLEDKRDPTTRETADHSLFFLLARALVDGEITPKSYAPELIADPSIRPLMQRITVVEDHSYTERLRSHGEPRTKVEVELTDGRQLSEETVFPRGHPMYPMDDAELEEKFNGSVERVLETDDREELRERLWNLGEEGDLLTIASLYRKFASSPTRS